LPSLKAKGKFFMNMLDDVEFQVAKLSLGPDDLLAVRVAKPISSAIATELRARLERQLNLVGRILVLDSGADLTVVTSGVTAPAGAIETKAGQSDTRAAKGNAAKA
jgi:hypothetical protein